MFQVRIVTVDHYMSPPIPELDVTYSDFRKSSIRQVPVVRIFGTTPSGIKTCVHVHGVFPYICIPYDGSQPHRKLSYQLAASLDKAINIASGYSTSNTQHVYKVVLVSGIPFYGYHKKRHQFLKVYFYKPSVIKQAVNLLQNGAILNKVFQPHEAHIPFILQFFIDFNLYGMSFIDFEHVKFRRTNFPELFSGIPKELMLPDTISAVSSSKYEVDAVACHISNRPSSQGNGQICNPGIAAIWEDENRRRAMKDGTPVDVPHLHSQRPPQNSTSSELFHLDRIKRILNNPSQTSDDSSLSGECATLVNKSYAMEEPPNATALDASFVSLHVTEPCSDNQVLPDVVYADDTIVDEDVVMNTSISQHLSQHLDTTVTLDLEDLELLDVLETLADTRSATVDNDSVLGSQTTKTICRPSSSVGDDDEANSEGEDEHWSEKTLVAEEDDPMKLFDLTMPDVDESAILNNCLQNEPQPGPSTSVQDNFHIPQLDGNSDTLLRRACKSRKKIIIKIPQVDGANDLQPKPGRKSLGMRGGQTRKPAANKDNVLSDGRYIPGTTDLIFRKKKSSNSSSPAVHPPLSNIKEIPLKTSLPVHSDVQRPCPSTSLGMSHNVDIALNSQDRAFDLEPLVFLVPSTVEDIHRPSSSLSNGDLFQPYYSESMPLNETGIEEGIDPRDASHTPTVGCSKDTEEVHCTESYIHAVTNSQKESILRGNPYLYPQAPLDKEEYITELMSSAVSNKNDPGRVKFSDDNLIINQEPTSTSSQIPDSHESVSELLHMDAKVPNDTWVHTTIPSSAGAGEIEGPDGNMTPGSISDISVSGMGPLLTTTMYNDIRETLDWCSSNTDASCSDSELCRLKDALDNNEMEEILHTDTEVCIPESSTSRREELLRVITESSQSSKYFEDPVSDKLLRRGELPRKGPPKLGKNMALAQLYCGTPTPPKKTSTIGKKELKRVRREERRLKLSVTAQRKKRNQSINVAISQYENLIKPCSVTLTKITKKNIYNVCKRWDITLADKSALGIRSRLSTSSSNVKSPSCSRKSRVSKSPAHSRAVTKSSTLSCGRTRRSYSKSELNKSYQSEDLIKLNTLKIKEECLMAGDAKPNENSDMAHVEVKAEHGKFLRSRRTTNSADFSMSLRSSERLSRGDQSYLKPDRVSDSSLTADTESPLDVNIKIETNAITPLCHVSPRRGVLPQNSSFTPQSVNSKESSNAPEAVQAEDGPCFTDQSSDFEINSNQCADNTGTRMSPTSSVNVIPPKHFAIMPGSTPTSIKISCSTLLNFEKECGNRDDSIDDGSESMMTWHKKSEIPIETEKKTEIFSCLDDTTCKSEALSCTITASMIPSETPTSTLGQKSIEILLKLANSDLGVHSQDLFLENANLENKSNTAGEETPESPHKKRVESQDTKKIRRRENEKMESASDDSKSEIVTNDNSSSILKESRRLYQQVTTNVKTGALRDSDKSAKGPNKSPTALSSPYGQNRKSILLCEPKEAPSGTKGSAVCKSNVPKSASAIEAKKAKAHYSVSTLKKRNTPTRSNQRKPCGTNLKKSSPMKLVPSSSRRSSNSSTKGNSKPILIADIIPEVQCSTLLKNFKIPKKPEKDHKDLPSAEADWNESANESLLVSLETSSIELDLNLSDIDENVLMPTEKKCLIDTRRSSKTISSQILCVDGASAESSSDSSSAGQETAGTVQESTLSHHPLKRKMVEDNIELNVKVQKDTNQNVPNNQRAGTSSDLPSTVAHWFDKRYGPWTMWSPNISPVRGHHNSPPHPFSPENRSESNFKGFAAMSHGCMEEVCENATQIDNKLPSTLSFGQDLLMRLKSMESSGVECGRNLKLNTEMEPNADVVDNSSGKTMTSIQDMFSERSFRLHEDVIDNAEENKSSHGMSDIASTSSSLSRNKGDLENVSCSEHEEFSTSPVPAFQEQNKFDICSEKSSSQSQEESMHDNIISSRESSGIPCGQAIQNEDSRERVKLSSDLKTLHKPPSRKEVIGSLHLFNIPEAVNPEPYFSNYSDVKGKVDVGSNVLDLTSNNCIHLEEFRSSIEGLRGLSCQQKQLFASCWGLSQVKGNFNQLVSTHFNRSITVISPVKKPPTVKDVLRWLKAKDMVMKAKKIDSRDKKKETKINLEQLSSIHASSALSKMSQVDKGIQASTPDSNVKIHKGKKVASPLLTPILIRSQSKANIKSNHLSTSQSLLPSVNERDEIDLGVAPLDSEAQIKVLNVSQNDSHDSSSVKQLLLDSQLCKDDASLLFRHDSDASACQIKGIASSPGFKMVLENLQSAKTKKEYQYTTTLTMEVHICTCGALNPDPERDPIRAIFYCVSNDVPENSETPASVNGIIAVNPNTTTPVLNRCGISGVIEYVNDEKSLFESLVSVVHQWDPDILAGFEIEMLSWGYVLQRASILGVNITQQFSRITDQKQDRQQDVLEDSNGLGGLKITGRIVLDAWRLFRSEVALQSYTFENLMYHILHKRVCHHSFESLSRWWEHPSHLQRWITVQYYQQRVSGIIGLLDQLDIIGRTSELARLFGIQFFEVLSRGSQFRVESMMLRLAKPLNYIPVSPSVQQRAHMRAPECLPLIMEPESRFYNDPMIVLDFQSLYPSMIIAYNYCFSTCLGRVEHLGKSGHFEFGCTELQVKNSHLRQLNANNDISVSPSGVAFVTKKVRQGVLPRMLEEILEARLAVKQSMKLHKKDHTLQRVLHARQLGLKLIANVTYGYTSANFSGRMPCIEVGDSVVSKGRETLERAISLVHNNKEWRARVVYGDTDSLFVLIPGRSREEAFRIGSEIASAVTQDNPSPVKLKLEKVYQPCILQTKKRYVGFMYESPDQAQPVYEAKGIETVRRDGCPAVSKMLEKSLKILFETCDVSSVKNYVSHQFSKILAGRANIQDLIFAREYRGKENYRAGACVPALELTKRWLRHDRRSEPRIGERVPYVVTNGAPGSALIHLVRHPRELLSDPSLRYNAVYYVTRAIIPPLARCFSLLGADVLSWYSDLPRKNQLSLPVINQAGFKRTISQYFSTMECACCGALTHGGVCGPCQSNPQLLVTSLMSKLHSLELTHTSITKICQSCLGRSAPLDCTSLDCPITYRRHQSSQKSEQTAFISQLLDDFGVTRN